MKEQIEELIKSSEYLYEKALDRTLQNNKEIQYIEQLINALTDAKIMATWLEDFRS